MGKAEEVEILPDWTAKCHPTAKDHFRVFAEDPDQSAELQTFIAHCPVGIRLLDVGAHYGFFALAAARFGGPAAQVLCVEASPRAVQVLQANLEVNRVTDQVQVSNVAMGARDGMLSMLATGPFGADYFVMPTEARSDTVQVPQRSLESLLAGTAFSPTHIKMDIEGAEFEVIEAGISFLAERKPTLFLELHGSVMRRRGQDPSAVVKMLRQAGYSKFQIGESEGDDSQMEALGYDCRVVCS